MHDADVPFKCNRPATVERRRQYVQWLAGLNINYRLIYVDESEYNVFTRWIIGAAPVEERVRNMNIILVINQEVGLVHHQLGQFTVTRNVFQNFITEFVN